MGNRKAIQIIIPTPCHESWDEMTPVDGGRHCAHCNKRVIDFTQSSDAELYKAVTSANGEICGRLLITQINRSISIPYQPHSRLFRIAIAMGLGLVFTQSPQVLAQNRPPMVQDSLISKQKKTSDTLSSKFTGGISGKVIDETKQGIINATVLVIQHGALIDGSVTDTNGNFNINSIRPGTYDLSISYIGYDSMLCKNIHVFDSVHRMINPIEMARDFSGRTGLMIITKYYPTLLPDPPTKRTFSRSEISRNW